ncbi:MAG: 30S ribosomal protein S6 [Candidatus Paceibacterota bacterium]|jgi:ribosomal protein S6
MKPMQANENNTLNEEGGDAIARVYELGYLLVPTLSEEEVPGIFGNLKDLVSSYGGIAISDEMPKMMTLAYPMVKVISNIRNKFKSAYFGWVKFTMDSDKVLELKKKLDLDSTVVRFLILKTVKENTIAAKRFVRGEIAHRKPKTEKGEDEVVVPINKEEIDKEIDAMVAVQ